MPENNKDWLPPPPLPTKLCFHCGGKDFATEVVDGETREYCIHCGTGKN